MVNWLKFRRHFPRLVQAFLSVSLSFSALADPTHEVIQEYRVPGNDSLVVPAGSKVEVLSEVGDLSIIKFTSPDGSSTAIQIPGSNLKKIPPSSQPGPSNSLPPPPVQSTPPPAQVPAGAKTLLKTKEGKQFEGEILRVESSMVVLLNGSSEVIDIPLSSLDEISAREAASWRTSGKMPVPDPRLIPGTTVTLTFPEAGPSYQSNPAAIHIRIPENYRSDQKVPLALFLGGGDGTDHYDSLNGLVDSKSFVLVAFPYSKNVPTPRQAVQDGRSNELIRFQRPMLERLQALIPNTDPDRRLVIGFSNGAHMIGVATCDGWREFTEYFSIYVFDEGGSSQNKDFKALKRKSVMYVSGEKSPSSGFNQTMLERFKESKVQVYAFTAPGEGHEMGKGSRTAIKEWLEKSTK